VNEEKFEQWAILELMGHRRLAGKVTDAEIGGGAFIRIDIPMRNGENSTQFYSPGAVYCITPTTEEIACKMAMTYQPEPVNRWEFAQLESPAPEQSNDMFGDYNGDDDDDAQPVDGCNCHDCNDARI
jgi:hypothetical protein